MKRLATVAIAVAAALAGCAAPTQPTEATAKDQLTTGQVQLTLKKNQTTQEEVLKSFGAPNLVTTNGQGEEVWTYQRNATVVNAKTSGSYGTIIFFGGSTRSSGLEQSSRTMTLIIKFKEINGAKRVSDFNSRSSSF